MMCKRYAAIRPYLTFHTHIHTLTHTHAHTYALARTHARTPAQGRILPQNVTTSHENRIAVQCSLPICLNRLAVCMVSV